MKSTIVETKIVINQKEYNQEFYLAESAAEIILPQFDDIVSSRVWTAGTAVDVSDKMPTGSPLTGATVHMTLLRTGNPPAGSGTSAAKTTAYYYKVDATVDNQTVEMGFWKASPGGWTVTDLTTGGRLRCWYAASTASTVGVAPPRPASVIFSWRKRAFSLRMEDGVLS